MSIATICFDSDLIGSSGAVATSDALQHLTFHAFHCRFHAPHPFLGLCWRGTKPSNLEIW
eukprot:scaffold602_cov179-Ochromonas_danica.AAC.14